MGRIVAIAGGDLATTQKINRYMVKLSGKVRPNALFIGTASEDDEGYAENFKNAFQDIGCSVKVLSLVKKHYSEADIDDLLSWADAIYVGGGDTVAMMKIWKNISLDKKLKEIYQKDQAVLGGISAGAICWFSGGHSDSEAFLEHEDWTYKIVDGRLGIHQSVFCPHYNEEGRNSFDEMLKGKNMRGLAMENETAFVDVNGEIVFIRSREDAKAYWLDYDSDGLHKKEVVFETLCCACDRINMTYRCRVRAVMI